MMKLRWIMILLLMLLPIYTYRQPLASVESNRLSIQIEPDSLFFETNASYDTLLVVNTGNVELAIDSIKSSKPFGYDFHVVTKDTTFYWLVVGSHDIQQFERNKLTLAPQDSALIISFAPDLCPICASTSSFPFFADTLFIFSNDSLHNPVEVFISGQGRPSAVETANVDFPEAFALHPNYPNPFNPMTKIRFSLPLQTEVNFSVYNNLGQKVRTLTQEHFPAGEHEIIWDGHDEENNRVSSGVYFLRMTIPRGHKNAQFAKTIRMTLTR